MRSADRGMLIRIHNLLFAICYLLFPFMDYVSLGNTGLKVSRLCLGCMSYGTPKWRDWVLDEEHSFPFFKQAAESGAMERVKR